MKKRKHVFITLEPREVEEIVHFYLKRKGELKTIPGIAIYSLFDDTEVCIEYSWNEADLPKMPKGNALLKEKK